MRHGILAGLVTVLVSSVSVAGQPFQNMTFEPARRKARSQQKAVMVYFYTTWCGPCKALDKTTWKDRKVRSWLVKNTVAIKVDCDKNKELPQQFNVKGYPTIVFTEPSGREMGRFVGYRDPARFLANANTALGKVGVTRKRRPVRKTRTVSTPGPSSASHGGDDRNDLMVRLASAQEQHQQGKYEEALAGYLWCFDHGNLGGRAFARLRLTGLLDEIVHLGEGHPPALAELKKRRKAVGRALLSGAAGGERIDELVALNGALGESARTLRTYDKLKRKGAAGVRVRREMFALVVDLLLQEKRYQDVLEGAAESSADIEKGIRFHSKLVRRMATDRGVDRETVDAIKEQLVGLAGKFYEAYLGTSEQEKAAELVDRIIELDTSGAVFAMFIRHALQAEAYDTARALKERAKEALSEEDYADISRVLSEIPKGT